MRTESATSQAKRTTAADRQVDVTTAKRPLRTGSAIPSVGLGVWQAARGAVTQNAVATALRLGYRHVDTARVYGNEADVGAGLRASGVPREEVFVTTKLWNDDHGYDEALRAFDASLARLRFDYVDLYLIHWPVSGKRRASWRALERLFEEKRARAIGVSNYMVSHLEELFGHANVPPAVNQIEVTPFHQQREVRALCAAHEIVVEAYSPLTRGKRLGDPTVTAIAARVGRTPAQVLLRWGIQEGMVELPKSTHEARIDENARLFDFELDAAAMTELGALDEGLATGWDPRTQD